MAGIRKHLHDSVISITQFKRQTYFPIENKVAEMVFIKPATFYSYFAQYHREFHRYAKQTLCHHTYNGNCYDRYAKVFLTWYTRRKEECRRKYNLPKDDDAQPIWKIIRSYLEELLLMTRPHPTGYIFCKYLKTLYKTFMIFRMLLIRDDENPDWFGLYYIMHYGDTCRHILISFNKQMLKIQHSDNFGNPVIINFVNKHRIVNGIEEYNVH